MSVRDSHFIEREGIHAVGAMFARFGWLFREHPTSDFGIDAHVEAVDEGQATGRLVALQIKSGRSYLRLAGPDSFRYYGDTGHLDYWTNHSLPVALVLFDAENQQAYWEQISQAAVVRTGTQWRIDVPRHQQLNSDALLRLREIAEGDPYVLGLRRLQLERSWMQLLQDGNRLFLEVTEWVNKMSGRGDFRLIVQDVDGEEQVARNWPYQIFGPIPYEELLPMLFPWADLSIDEDYYEENEGQYFAEVSVTDDDTKDHILMESWSDWAGTKPRLRPYENDGEVADWRLELTLGPLGKAFLTLDQYLTSGPR